MDEHSCCAFDSIIPSSASGDDLSEDGRWETLQEIDWQRAYKCSAHGLV